MKTIWHKRSKELPEEIFGGYHIPVIAVDKNKKYIGTTYGLGGSIEEIKYWAKVDDILELENKLKAAKQEIKTLKNSVSHYFDKATEAYIKLHFLEERMKEDAHNQRIADTMKITE